MVCYFIFVLKKKNRKQKEGLKIGLGPGNKTKRWTQTSTSPVQTRPAQAPPETTSFQERLIRAVHFH